jgi:hypothetical protein
MQERRGGEAAVGKVTSAGLARTLVRVRGPGRRPDLRGEEAGLYVIDEHHMEDKSDLDECVRA